MAQQRRSRFHSGVRRRLLLLPLPVRRRRTHDGDTRTRILLFGVSVHASTHLFLLNLTPQRLPFTNNAGRRQGVWGDGGGGGVLLLGVCLTHIYSAEPPCVLDEPLKAAPTGSDQIYAPDRTFFCVRFDLVNLPLLEFVPSADRFGDNSTRV